MKINVKEITIHWAEGGNQKYDKFPKTYSSYAEVNKALKPIYEDFAEIGEGYNKVKFTLMFEDGENYEGRLYVSEKYDIIISLDNLQQYEQIYTLDEQIEDMTHQFIAKYDNPTKSYNVIGEHIKDFLNNIIKNNENDKEDRTNANNFINNYQL